MALVGNVSPPFVPKQFGCVITKGPLVDPLFWVRTASPPLRAGPGPVASPGVGGEDAAVVLLAPAEGVELVPVALALIAKRLLVQDFLIEMRGKVGQIVELVGILPMGDAVLFDSAREPRETAVGFGAGDCWASVFQSRDGRGA